MLRDRIKWCKWASLWKTSCEINSLIRKGHVSQMMIFCNFLKTFWWRVLQFIVSGHCLEQFLELLTPQKKQEEQGIRMLIFPDRCIWLMAGCCYNVFLLSNFYLWCIPIVEFITSQAHAEQIFDLVGWAIFKYAIPTISNRFPKK